MSYIGEATAPFSRNSTARKHSRVPGNRAIWVGIFAEFTEFALMFLVYFFARIHHPQDFHEGPQKLSMLAGSMNTALMITSSFFVARAIVAMRAQRQDVCMRWLVAALITAAGYPLVKFLEIRWNVSQGLTGGGDVFLMSYYYLTFNHLVHVSWGILGLGWVMARTWFGSYSAANHNGLVAFASYWHATDLIWLMIFPLFYVLP
ncbi:MAG: cytochrome c oxidase subunit 3 family protein [Pseudomonadota bacterium]